MFADLDKSFSYERKIQELAAQHPVLQAAAEYVDKKFTPSDDESSDEKTVRLLQDEFLFQAGIGALALIREAERQTTIPSPYDIEELYVLLALLNRKISGLMGSLASAFVSQGLVSSATEAQLYITKAKLAVERRLPDPKETRSVPMIGIVGAISSGKGTVGELLEHKFGGQHFPLSDRLREVSLAQGGNENFPREILRQINDTLKPAYGLDVFVRWTTEMVQRIAAQAGHPVVSLDGFRSVKEAETFKEQGGVLIGVQADQEVRFQRLQKRGRPGDDDWEKFLESDAIESGWITPIFAICDFTIENNGKPSELEAQVDEICSKLEVVR